MKKIKRDILTGIGSAAAINIIALLLIPSLILLIFTSISKIPGTDFAPINKVDIPKKITIYITSTGNTAEIDFEEYITGVVACEMPSSFEEEALKAQAVAARTYALSKIIRSGESGFPSAHPAAAVCDDVHCQAYMTQSQLEVIKGANWIDSGYKKVCKAVEDTKGELMYYDGVLVSQALFHSSSGGRTENSEDVFASAVPYLRSVESPYEEDATHKDEKTTFSLLSLAQKLNSNYRDRFTGNFTAKDVKVTSHSEGGRVESFKVGNAVYTGREVREALGLSSANFTVSASSDGESIIFTSNGYGHGVGMSQYGANGMAKEGYDYKKILMHYYSGIRIV